MRKRIRDKGTWESTKVPIGLLKYLPTGGGGWVGGWGDRNYPGNREIPDGRDSHCNLQGGESAISENSAPGGPPYNLI